MNYKLCFACLAIVALLALAVIAPSDPPNKQKQQSNTAQHNKKVSSPSIVSPSEGFGARLRENSAVIAAGATIVIAVFTGVLWWATRKQAVLTRQAMISRERAFVFPIDLQGEWEPIDSRQYGWRFRPRWFNSGNTPTKNLKTFVTYELREGLMPDSFNFPDTGTNYGENFLAPHYGSWAGLIPPIPTPPFTTQDLVDIQVGKKVLYMWGWAKYNDVFQETPMHISKFCWLIVPNGNPALFDPRLGIPQQFTFITNAKGNCADEECSGQD